MKQFTHLTFRSGEFRAFVMPEDTTTPEQEADFLSGARWTVPFQQALERAIEEGVEVTLTGDIRKEAWPTSILDEDSIFDIPVGYRIEGKEEPEFPGFDHTSYPTFITKHFLVPVENESLPVGKEQETPDNLWYEFLYDIGSKRNWLAGESEPEEWEKMQAFLESKYTITITRKTTKP